MNIPAESRCRRMLKDMGMPVHIQDHSRLVCRVALALADELAKSGLRLHRELVRAAAILHDITKLRSFKTGENHAQSGGDYLTGLGFPEVGDIVRQHVVLDDYAANTLPNEAEVVNYADKRVLHDQIVSLDQRMTYILDRYAKTEDHRRLGRQLWRQTRELEQRLFSHLDFLPQDLASRLNASQPAAAV